MISFITSTYVSIDVIVWSICIGANIAVLLGYFSKNYVGVFVRRLLDYGTGEENAKTIYDLGLEKQFIMKYLLRDLSSLRNTVSVIGGALPKIKVSTKNGKEREAIDWQSAKFYISERNEEKARHSYGTKFKWLYLPVFIVLSCLCAWGMTYVVPYIFSLVGLS